MKAKARLEIRFVCSLLLRLLKGQADCCAPEPVEKDRGAHEEVQQHGAPLRSVV